MALNPILPAKELEVLKRWKEKNIFQKTLAQTAKGERFVFYEGPPTANGRPGIHHILARAYKDVICRYKTMQGFFVERKAGWDTHGLPVELEVEKRLGLKSKKEIEQYGVEKFNEECKKSVWKYKEEWEKMTERIGYWLDLENPYITYDKNYIESLWWVIKQIWDKDLLYKGYKVVPQCPRCGTALSSHEVAQGYEKVKDNAVTVKFELVDEPGTFILAWTTTPWTLPGNVALAVGKDILYVKTNANKKGERYIIASSRYINANDKREPLLNEDFSTDVGVGGEVANGLENLQGSELIGKKYKQLFNIETINNSDKSYQIYDADFVTLGEGTGVVHTAVMYGEDDYQLGEKVGLPKVHTVNPDGTFNDLVPQWAGKFVKDPDVEQEIIKYLRDNNLLYGEPEPHEHDYPFCWRCHSPLIYYAKDSWFIKMSSLRKQLQKNNEQINWVPEYIKEGRFGEWLKEAKDWAFSRERYWGTPLPIWECQHPECHEKVCVGSFEELNRLARKPLTNDFDPHRPFVDDILLTCPRCQSEMWRVKELCDVWFDSGCMPYAQWHYPFENKERVDKGISYPADYISEAIDQTRGWFYTLLAVATALKKDQPYKNVVCLAHVLDAKGQKMSKHIGNVVEPNKAIDEFGADAIRWFFFTASQPGETKNYDPKILNDIIRKNFLILSNVLTFFQMYAGQNAVTEETPHIMDQWIIDVTAQLTVKVTGHLDHYRVTEAGRLISDFINDLSTWYVRRSRDRFKNDEMRDQAVDTLRRVLLNLAKLMAPFAPFYADELFLQAGGKLDSVHLESWPKPDHAPTQEVIENMNTVRLISEAVHALRAESGVKLRQPLAELVVAGASFPEEYEEVLGEEINVQTIRFEPEVPKGENWKTKITGQVSVALNTAMTPELAWRGLLRELVRQINSSRKKAGLTIKDQVELTIDGPKEIISQLKKLSAEIAKDTISRNVVFDLLPQDHLIAGEFSADSGKISFALKR